MPVSDCFVSIVAPLYNDGDIVESFISDAIALLKREYANYELVLVDDGSSDDTTQKVTRLLEQHSCIRFVRLSRRFGTQAAITAGLDSVIGDFVVIMMPETDPPDLVPQMVEQCRRGVGVVIGIRRHRHHEPFYMRAGASLFYWLFNRVLQADLPRNSTDFRVLSRQSVNAIIRIKDRLRYLRTFCTYVGYGSTEFAYEPICRRARPRRKRFGEALSLAVRLIVANSTHPLRAASVLGGCLSLLSLIHVGYVALVYLLDPNVVAGWATQSLHSSVMFMFVFLILAVLCEYIGRLLEDVKDRPVYYLLEERTSSVLIADEERKNVVTESRAE